MKYFLILVTLLSLLSCKKIQKGTGQETIKIGAIYPLTGNGAQYGKYFKDGTDLAYHYAIQEGLIKDNAVKFIIEDGAGDATKSISAFNNLVTRNNISGCLTDLSSVLVPIKPLINQKKIPTINSSSFSTSIETDDDYMFSILPNADSYAKQIAEFSFNVLKKRNAAVIYRNDDMGVSFNEVFQKTFETLGGSVITTQGHPKGASDYTDVIEKLRKNNNIDFVFCASYGVEVANLLKQARELGYKNEFITFQGFIIPEVFDIAGQATEGVYVIASKFSGDGNSDLFRKTELLAKNKLGLESLNFYTAAHFDAAMMFIEAFAEGNTSASQIREYFDSPDYSFNGLTGVIRFNNNGLADMQLSSYIVNGQSFILYKKQHEE